MCVVSDRRESNVWNYIEEIFVLSDTKQMLMITTRIMVLTKTMIVALLRLLYLSCASIRCCRSTDRTEIEHKGSPICTAACVYQWCTVVSVAATGPATKEQPNTGASNIGSSRIFSNHQQHDSPTNTIQIPYTQSDIIHFLQKTRCMNRCNP